MRRAFLILPTLLALTACTPTPAPSPTVDYAAVVAERYAGCVDGLDLAYTPVDDGGTLQLGIVTGIREGAILTWSVAESNTGDLITVPADVETTEILTAAGC